MAAKARRGISKFVVVFGASPALVFCARELSLGF